MNGYITAEMLMAVISATGVALSAALTFDSWLRYMRIIRFLKNGNHFPMLHLRTDLVLFMVQLLQGGISLVWFQHLRIGEPIVVSALEHLWPVYPLRMAMVLLLAMLQVRNCIDRHHMRFDKRSSDAPDYQRPKWTIR